MPVLYAIVDWETESATLSEDPARANGSDLYGLLGKEYNVQLTVESMFPSSIYHFH